MRQSTPWIDPRRAMPRSWVVRFLLIQVVLTTFLWVAAEKRASYLAGREALYKDMATVEEK